MDFSDIMDVHYNHAEVLIDAFGSLKKQDRVISIYCQNLQEIKVSKFLLSMFSETVRNVLSTESYYCVPQCNIFLPDCSLKSVKNLLQLIMTGFVDKALYEDMTDIVETAKVLLIDISNISFYQKDDIAKKDEEAELYATRKEDIAGKYEETELHAVMKVDIAEKDEESEPRAITKVDFAEIDEKDDTIIKKYPGVFPIQLDYVTEISTDEKSVNINSLSSKEDIELKPNEVLNKKENVIIKNDSTDFQFSYKIQNSEEGIPKNMETNENSEEIKSVPEETYDDPDDVQIDTVESYLEGSKPDSMETNGAFDEMKSVLVENDDDDIQLIETMESYSEGGKHKGMEISNSSDDFTQSKKENVKELMSETICQLCKTECYNISNLWLHYSNTHFYTEIKIRFGYLIENNECTICKKSFSTTSGGIHHLAKAHQKVNDVLKLMNFSGIPPSKDYSYKFLPDNKSREKVMLEEDKFKCSHCNKSFSDNSKLKVHSRLHTGQKPFPCDKCSKSFSQIGNLQAHERIHSKSKPYPCTKCDKSFKQLTHLNQHNRTHTGERPFPCEFCNRSYRQAYTLIIHKRIHTGEKPYKCDQCIDTFPSSTAVKLHKKKLHAKNISYGG